MTADYRVVDVTGHTLDATPCCGIKNRDHPGLRSKATWLRRHFAKGLRAEVLLTPQGVQCGYIEYLPGRYAWRGVEADGYMVIHCVWTHLRAYQHQGMGTALIQSCIADARREGMQGVAVVARDRPWLAGSAIFRKLGFEVVDTAPPDYELLVYRLRKSAATPRFKGNWEGRLKRYGKGLTIIRADQCPHTVKRSDEIAAVARQSFGLNVRIVNLMSYRDAQNAPTPYAVFAIIYNGRLLADHQVSARRFQTILKQALEARVSSRRTPGPARLRSR